MPITPSISEAINNILPQTQCGLCGYKGCKPYAEAIATQNESIDRCPPGGTETLFALAELTHTNPTPYLANMQEKSLPPQLAVIREDECIGCTKCIQACPVDAIIGAAKFMHTIIGDECTGCGLCIPPCPVDCIDLLNVPPPSAEEKHRKAHHARARFEARNLRLAKNKEKQMVDRMRKNKTTAQKISAISVDEIKASVGRVIARKKQRSISSKIDF